MKNSKDDSLSSLSVEQFLTRIASDRPIPPAAGSAAALAGATAAAMGGFVARIAHRHALSQETAENITPLIDRFDRLRRRLSDLITEDAESCAVAMREKNEHARRRMLGPPIEIAGLGVEILDLCTILFPFIHPPTRADIAVAAEMAKAAVNGALRITSANLSTFEAADIADQMADLLRRADDLYSHLNRSFEKTF